MAPPWTLTQLVGLRPTTCGRSLDTIMSNELNLADEGEKQRISLQWLALATDTSGSSLDKVRAMGETVFLVLPGGI